MSISTLIGSRLLSGIAAFALTGSLVGATAVAAQPDNPVRELRHDLRDQSKAQRDEVKQLRREFAAEYAKEQPDTQKLERLQAEIEAKRAEISELRFAALMQMHDELDAKQRQKIAERMAHEGKGHHKRGEGERDGAKGKGKAKAKAKAKAKKADERERPERESAAKPKHEGKGKQADERDRPEREAKAKTKAKAKADKRKSEQDRGERAPV